VCTGINKDESPKSQHFVDYSDLKTSKKRSFKLTPHLNHRLVAEQYEKEDVDLYVGGLNEPSYILYPDQAEPVTEDDMSLILNILSTGGGVESDPVLNELTKKNICMKTMASLQGEKTEDVYFKKIHCLKWWCPNCGDHRDAHGKLRQGQIHKNRRRSVYARLNGGYEVTDKATMKTLLRTLKNTTQIQYIFTVPESERGVFFSKDGLNRLTCSVKRIITSEYPDSGMVAYIHVVGDNSTKYHPHINVHVYLEGDQRVCPLKNEDGVIYDEQLERIKKRYKAALRAHGCSIDVVDIQKTFVRSSEPIKMLHRIKYMTKPIESDMLQKWQNEQNEEMIRFSVYELKGFRYVRYWGKLNNNKYKQWFEEMNKCLTHEELEEMNNMLRTKEEKLAGERLKAGGLVMIDIEKLKKRDDLIVEELAEGFYRVRRKAFVAKEKEKL